MALVWAGAGYPQPFTDDHLCQEPISLVESPPLGWSAVQWLDANRFFLLGGQEGSWRLALGAVGAAAVPLAEMDTPYYQWNR